MSTTNTRTIIEKNQNHISRHYHGGKTGFVEQIDYFKKRGYSTQRAIEQIVSGGGLLVYNADIRSYLHRIGLKDDKKLDNYRGYGGGVFGLYTALMVRDGTKLYNEYKKKHPARR